MHSLTRGWSRCLHGAEWKNISSLVWTGARGGLGSRFSKAFRRERSVNISSLSPPGAALHKPMAQELYLAPYMCTLREFIFCVRYSFGYAFIVDSLPQNVNSAILYSLFRTELITFFCKAQKEKCWSMLFTLLISMWWNWMGTMNVQALKKECHKSLFQTEFVLNVNWITLLLLLDSCGHHSLALCEECSVNMLQNFSFCVLHRKVTGWIWKTWWCVDDNIIFLSSFLKLNWM